MLDKTYNEVDYSVVEGKGLFQQMLEKAIKEWNEADHPREPAGSSEGGQFTDSPGGGSSPEDVARRLKDLQITFDVDDRIPKAKAKKVKARIAEVVDSLAENYPIIKNSLRGLKIVVRNGDMLASREEGAHAYARFSPAGKVLNVASGVSLTPSKAPVIGDFTIGTDMGSVIAHEIGHVAKIPLELKAQDSKLPNIHDLYRSKDRAYWKSTVSTYGSSNKDELLSEAFAAYTHPGYSQSKNKLAPEFVDRFEKIGLHPGKRKGLDIKEGNEADHPRESAGSSDVARASYIDPSVWGRLQPGAAS